MKHYKYLIIGGGLTGDAGVRGIRELDAEGSIGMISIEPDPPYTRPSLSKGLWKGRPLEKRIPVEHEDNAIKMGELAGRNMVGADESYNHVPMFYSDLFELGYEAVGEISSKMETVTDWQESFNKGVIYYLESGRVRGVLLWNVWKQVDNAGALIAEAGPFKAADLKGRLS